MPVLAERIYEDLKGRILRFELRPGERLLEEELARKSRASRTPIREACQRLLQAGLVRAGPRRGYYVRDINLLEIEQLYDVRIVLEDAAVILAVQRGDLTGWTALADVWSKIPDPLPSPEAMLDLDEGFHISIAEAGRNAVLTDYLRSVNERIRAIRTKDFTLPHRIHSTYVQHGQILALILARDAARACAAMREHIRESQANVIDAVKELLAAVYLR